MSIASPYPQWATLDKIAAHTGLTTNALRELIKKGMLTKQHHWIKAPNNRLMIHVRRFDAWLEGIEA